MPQRLILPINKCRVTASFGTEAYHQRFGFSHYGVDMVSFEGSSKIYASGNGIVLKMGQDNCFGNVVVVRYDNVYNHKTQTTESVICRYYHLNKIMVNEQEIITKDTNIGNYGNTGQFSTGAHLHIECDSDVQYYMYTSTLGKNSSLMRAALTNTSIDPMELFHCKKSPPECQEIITDKSTYNNKYYADPAIENIPRTQ